MKTVMELIYKFLKRNRGKKYSALEIGRYVNRKTNRCDRYYQPLAALVGRTLDGEKPAFTKWAKDLGVYASIDRSIIDGKSFYQYEGSK